MRHNLYSVLLGDITHIIQSIRKFHKFFLHRSYKNNVDDDSFIKAKRNEIT